MTLRIIFLFRLLTRLNQAGRVEKNCLVDKSNDPIENEKGSNDVVRHLSQGGTD
jgi:hypothetical protein